MAAMYRVGLLRPWLFRGTASRPLPSFRFLTLFQVSEMLGLSRVETEDFLGHHHVPLSPLGEADLDREAATFEAASRRRTR